MPPPAPAARPRPLQLAMLRIAREGVFLALALATATCSRATAKDQKKIEPTPEPSVESVESTEVAEAGVDWTIVPGLAVGPVSIGEEKHAVVAALGEPDSWGSFYGKAYAEYLRLGLGVSFTNERVDAIVAHSGVHGGYAMEDWRPFAGETREHLGADATYARIAAVYGAPVDEGKRPSAPVPSFWLRYHGVQFELTDPARALVTITVFADKK